MQLFVSLPSAGRNSPRLCLHVVSRRDGGAPREPASFRFSNSYVGHFGGNFLRREHGIFLEEAHPVVAVFQGFFLEPRRGDFHGVALGVAEDEKSIRRKQAGQKRVVEQLLGERLGAFVPGFVAVGRVGEEERELAFARAELHERLKRVLHAHLQAFAGEAGEFKILFQHLRVAAAHLDAHGGCRAAAHAIETERTGAGEKFEHARAHDAFAEAVENRLLDEVRRGPDVEALGDFENAARRRSASDTHGGMKTFLPWWGNAFAGGSAAVCGVPAAARNQHEGR